LTIIAKKTNIIKKSKNVYTINSGKYIIGRDIMKNALEINIGGIKCDNPNCDFMDMSVKVEDYDKWLNKPCPKCGENLLTDDDYRNVQFLLAMEKIANEIYPKIEDDESIVKATIDMNGTGNIYIAIDDNNKTK